MDAAGVIATYVMDGDRPLTAESAGNTTFYLYGLGAIGEKTTTWSFSLPDGTNTPRQLTDAQGDVTLSARYTPWGDTLELHGTGNFSFGYLGGVLDATTGLLYIGNGQYYDPSTGRFLTRDVYPNSTNPYVPWNPIGAILGPLGVIALVFGRKKKGSKTGTFLVLLLVVGLVGMTLSACGPAPTPIPTPPPPQPPNQQPTIPSQPPSPTQTPSPTIPPSPTQTPSPTCTPTPIPTTNEDFKSLIEYRFGIILSDDGENWPIGVASNFGRKRQTGVGIETRAKMLGHSIEKTSKYGAPGESEIEKAASLLDIVEAV